jgi:hypothetical protein
LSHQLVPAEGLFLLRNRLRGNESGGPFFVRVGENPQVVQICLGAEAKKSLEVRFGLAGKAHDEELRTATPERPRESASRARFEKPVPGRFMAFRIESLAC